MRPVLVLFTMLHGQPAVPGPGAAALCSQTVVSARTSSPASDVTEATSASRLRWRGYVLPARRVRLGAPVELRLAIHNDGPRTVNVTTGPGLRVRILDRRGLAVWTFPPVHPEREEAIPSIGCLRAVPPDAPFEFGVTWDLTEANGREVPPGDYVAVLEVDAHPIRPAAERVRITVLPRASERSRRR